MSTEILIANIVLIIPALVILLSVIQFVIENERRAFSRLGIVFISWVIILIVLNIWGSLFAYYSLISLAGAIIILAIFIFVPWPERKWLWERGIPGRIDERTIMFSRAELIPGTKRFEDYYNEFPEHREPDNLFRKFAGLLQEGSTFYNPFIFGAADAAFFTVESLHARTDGIPSALTKPTDPYAVTEFIKRWAMQMGCYSIGITLLKPHHLYHTGGRKHNYGEKVVNSHKFAIALSVEMDLDRVRSAPRGPIVMESSAQYLRSGSIAVQIAAFIRRMGYPARAHIDGKYQVRCTEVARDAGLGELGRMSLLMTPGLGPRIRLAVVTTDIPLITDTLKPQPSMLRFCRICKKCAENCPSSAISFGDPEETGGTRQWVINQEACYTYWCKTGTDCGRCISVCPYSHPDNLLHNSVRSVLRISPRFVNIALKMDNWLYGRRPPEKKPPGWMLADWEDHQDR
jgi:reductive dehalogenase